MTVLGCITWATVGHWALGALVGCVFAGVYIWIALWLERKLNERRR